MNIYLVRHGQTNWNKTGKVQGRTDIPLNEEGIEEARECGRAFARTGLKINTIVTSPLGRARETGKIIAESLPVYQIISDDSLIERSFGEKEGQVFDRIKYYDTFGSEEGMEPLEELKKRMILAIEIHGKTFSDEDIIMVSHGGAINALIHHLTDGKKGSGISRLKNTSINKISYKNGEIKLEVFNMAPQELSEINK